MRVRRRWFESRPARRRRLDRPVISVGNLSMGGTGKTPVVGAIVEWLLAQGEQPAILSRGYARTDPADGVVVVSDGVRVLAPLDRAGDEPLMLARRFPHAIVCVSPDRYLSGALAERRLAATVHVLDDGFQHLALARDLDVLVTTIGEIPQGRVIPRGRLRESMDAAARAHLLVVNGATSGAASAEAWALGISQSCGVEGALGEPVAVRASQPVAGQRVLAVAGIAHPLRFAEALRSAGWQVSDVLSFPDHHRYTNSDIEQIEKARIAAGADAVFTTEKDAVRFEGVGSLPFALHRVPQTLTFDPPDTLFSMIRATLDRFRTEPSGIPA
jgi:tetraacyldisaccharide 4'-kinase